MASPSQALHWAQTISNTTWGHQLSFHPFSRGDAPVHFSSLWPDKEILVATYKEANLGQCVFDLCKLLLVTSSDKSLDALLEDHVLMINHVFDQGKTTLAHLACALGSNEIVTVLMKRAGNGSNTIWTQKDDDDRLPIDVCFVQRIRQLLPSRSLFGRKKVPQGQPLKSEDRDRIFLMARNPDEFYKTIINLQIYSFEVNRERDGDGDYLVHLAVRGGLPQLPLLYALVSTFRADVSLRNGEGLTPLCLAAKLGEEKLAEVLICAFGADINASCGPNLNTPLHFAVLGNHPRLVSMLVRRGADAAREDKNKCEPSFIARRVRAFECRQIISQHLLERTERLSREANNGTLDVKKLYPSDAFVVGSNGCTLIMMAAMNNRTEVLKQLVKMENSPLDFKQMKSCESIESSMRGASDSWSDMVPDDAHSLKTAVHMAAERGYDESLQILIDAGAHPAIADAAAWFPIHYACDNGHLKCVKVIVNFPNQLGLSGLRPALDVARGNKHEHIVTLLEEAMQRRQKELINPLLFEVAHSGNKDLLFKILENGDDVNPINESHDWPLLLAAGFGYIDLVTQLLEFGGHATRRHRISKSTPLHVAARGGHSAVVRYLLRLCHPRDGDEYRVSPLPAGANDGDDVVPQYLDINGRNSVGATPLELAASQGHLEVVRLLLDHGACVTLPDSNGRLINIPGFAGTQFLIETSRKLKRKRIMSSLQNKLPLKDFKKIWQGPSDFNLQSQNGDSMLMVAAQFARVEVLRFLLESAKACRPGQLISPGQAATLRNYCSSQSEESFSENSLPRDVGQRKRSFRNHSHSMSIHPSSSHHRRTLSAHEYEEDSDDKPPPQAWTAVGGVVRGGARGGFSSDSIHYKNPLGNRFTEGSHSSRRRPGGRPNSRAPPPRSYVGPHPPLPAVHHSSATTPSSDDDGDPTVAARGNGVSGKAVATSNGTHHDANGAAVSGAEAYGEEFIGLVRYVSPKDGQTLLHRAAEGCLPDNVTLLLQTDKELANIQDNYGNTALQIACSKAHKPTVKAFLNFSCVDTSVRNNNGELPEAACLKSAIKKLVCKQRVKQVGDNLPATPQWRGHPEGLPSVERAPPNGFPRAIAAAQLSQIPESPNSTVSSDNLTMSQFQARIEQLKTEVKQKHENGTTTAAPASAAAPPPLPLPLPSPPSAPQLGGANGNDYATSGRFN